jgi:hypothetical protein
VFRFVVAISAVANTLRASGYAIAGTMDGDAKRNETFIAYEETQPASASQVKPRKLRWNVRAWNEHGKHSLGWYGSAETAITGAIKIEELAKQMATIQGTPTHRTDIDVPGYKDFPKSDARRYFTALLSVDKLKERATIHYVAQDIGCTRAEAQRALEATATQFGVVFQRDGSLYRIENWGVLNKSELQRQIKSVK